MSQKQYTVLLADDDPDYLFQVAYYLRKAGFEVVAVESQTETEQVISRLKPDIAVFDLMMENDDSGFILCYKLKRKYPDVPVILATAVSRETGISFGLNSGQDREWIRADLYLEKGVRPEQLEQGIKKLLKI
ncbi:MAG: response regulator [Bacteroidales bacterium]|jgi:two-component system alkaline phosphatase synthesis response regulator PhoP|nr:response regulator [Bacteroidales bacterium]